MKKNNILISFVICVLFNGFLHAADCYVLGSANPALADGTEEHPYNTIQECRNVLNNDAPGDTIYIGAGDYYGNVNLGHINVVGSGVNVTKIHHTSNGGTCFADVKGTIRDLSFDEYTYFINGSNTTSRCGTCISTGYGPANIQIINVLFKSHTSSSIAFYGNFEMDLNTYEIRNNVFANDYNIGLAIEFYRHENITFMNNLILRSVGFNNVNTYGGGNNKFHNNLFIGTCSLPNFFGSTYNLVYNGPNENANGYSYGDQDYSCGEMGEYQETDDFYNFSDLNLLVDTWNIYNIYASGENTILFDKGNPDTQFNDADGSRSDIGIMGGLYPWPFSSGPVITNFSADPINVQIDGEINVNSRSQTE
tara:strand:+ start:3210 stop:4304 length:1095 start_codon:yes stop_codon:yes gene_type:complete